MNGLDVITFKSLGLISNKKKDVDRITESHERNFEIKVNSSSIFGFYIHDLNILELNDCVLRIMENKKKHRIEELEKVRLEESYKILMPQYPIERKYSLVLLKNTVVELEGYANNTNLNEYISKVTPILNDYKILGSLKTFVTFGRSTQFNTAESVERKVIRFSLIEKYLEIANKYIEINVYRKSISKGCMSCGYDISNLESIENENIICPNCNLEITELTKPKGESSNIKKNASNYEGRVNFINELHRYQGKPTKSKIPDNLTELLDNHFRKKNFPIGNDIKANPSLITKTSKDLMHTALKTIKLSTLYKDINLICHLYWGYKLINLEDLESQIMEKYDLIDKVYEGLKEERSSSLNTQYELWWILSTINYSCDISDFKIPKTPDIFNYHEKMREKISKVLNWKYTPVNYMTI